VILLAEILFALLCLIILAWPFSRRGRARSSAPNLQQLSTIRQRREAVYEEIRSLELERELGSIEPQDFQRRLRSYRIEAAAVIQEQETIELWLMNQENSLEKEIQQQRLLLEDYSVETDVTEEDKGN
jgi:hypothetical protein